MIPPRSLDSKFDQIANCWSTNEQLKGQHKGICGQQVVALTVLVVLVVSIDVVFGNKKFVQSNNEVFSLK